MKLPVSDEPRPLVLVLTQVAEASVDYETDHRIQHTIAKAFRDRTILCIARASS